MTEDEWLNCIDSVPILTFLQNKGAEQGWLSCTYCRVRCSQQMGFCPAYRKLRLVSCACCHRILSLLPALVCRNVLRALEDYLEGATDLTSYVRAYHEFDQTRRSRFPKDATPDDGAWNALYCAVHRKWLEHFDKGSAKDRWRILHAVAMDAAASTGADEIRAQADLLRDIFGNPFHPVMIDSGWLAWNDGTVPKLAQGIYNDRAFDHLPILADALEESGCTNSDILAHCRQPGEHVRGCWVVDLMLGKE